MIGIFDVGVGGFSVLRALQKILPQYAVSYLADTGRFPYSPRPLAEKLAFSLQDADFLIEKGAEIIVIACNSITCFAGEPIRDRVRVPVFNVISAGAQAAVLATRNKCVGVIGSVQTGNSPAYPEAIKRLDQDVHVALLASQLMVYLVEEGVGQWSEVKPLVKRIIRPLLDDEIDTLVLGCTHFPFLIDAIRDAVGAGITLVDPGLAVAQEIKTYLSADPDILEQPEGNGVPRFYVSGDHNRFLSVAGEYYGTVHRSQSEFVDWSKVGE